MNTRQRIASVSFLAVWLLACSHTYGQHWYAYAPPPTEFDWQLFAPIAEMDISCDEVTPSSEGYFFEMRRMRFWMSNPDRAAVGNPVGLNPTPVYIPNDVNYAYYDLTGVLPTTPTGNNPLSLLAFADSGSFGFQFNSVSDSTPRASTGWGNRFDIGWIGSEPRHGSGSTGWMLSVMSGLDMNNEFRYGFDDKRLDQLGAAQGLDGIDGDPNTTPPTLPVGAVPGIPAIPHDDGLANVGVFFRDDFNLLLGFVDRDGDQLPDDLQTPPDGINFGPIQNGGDQVRLGVVFDDMTVVNSTKMSGVELLAMRRKKRLYGGAMAEIFVGARYLELNDRFSVTARGGILADSNWGNFALNRIVGPQFGLRIAKRSRRISTVISGRFMAGANMMTLRQTGVLGSHLTTSGAGNFGSSTGLPLSFGGHEFVNVLNDPRFSPTGEFRIQSGLHVTRGVTLTAAWEGIVVGGVARGANTIDYALPSLGILNRQEEIFTHGVTFGFEINR